MQVLFQREWGAPRLVERVSAVIRQIVVGFADVPTAREATRQAAELAAALGAGLHVVSAVEDDETVVLDVGSDRYELSESAR